MLFYICIWPEYDEDGNEIPNTKYDEVRRVSGIRFDIRNVDSPSKLKYRNAEEDWYEDGKNHRVENGLIYRDFEEEFYVIEMNTLEDLLNFQKKYGTNASVKTGMEYVYQGEVLNEFHHDYYME